MPNFDQKIFWFPDEWTELRKELETHWNPVKTGEYPHHLLAPKVKWTDPRVGWALAFDAEMFLEFMNEQLGGVFRISMVTDDKELHIRHICGTFLKELRKKRGERNP